MLQNQVSTVAWPKADIQEVPESPAVEVTTTDAAKTADLEQLKDSELNCVFQGK